MTSNLKEKIEKILNIFKEKESFLLENNINERAITAKLAEYFNLAFSNYNVDCEYSKMLDEDEKSFITKKLDLDIEEISSDDKKGITVYPDIIVHKRGNNNKNHIIIEVKKKEYADKKRKESETYRDFDKRKIKAYMEQLYYKNGFYIEFNGLDYEIEQIYFM